MGIVLPLNEASDTRHNLMAYDVYFQSMPPTPAFRTKRGVLFDGDCLSLLPMLKSDSLDLVFADPPFNLGKIYGPKTDDSLAEDMYIKWCYEWINESVRVLKPGGSLFIYNLPKWNIILGARLLDLGMMFRHWIAIDLKTTFPIQGRLYPSHYSLLYYTKGKPATFRKIRTPIERCRHCNGELRDYGGHRPAMNPLGVNLKDIWTDVPPVRHSKFKSPNRPANALSTKILDRVIEISTKPNDVVLDPFGGSGTTFAVCEEKGRNWIGIELDHTNAIIERLSEGSIGRHVNNDIVEDELNDHIRDQAYRERKNTKRRKL